MSKSDRHFNFADQSLFFSRGDASDPRLGDRVRPLEVDGDQTLLENVLTAAVANPAQSEIKTYLIAGYPDDEGIRTNGGRLGASLAPNIVRKYLYKMTPSVLRSPSLPDPFALWDLGNLDLSRDLSERHRRVQSAVCTTLNSGARWIGIGGGHDYGFPDAAGFIEWCKSQALYKNVKPLILNFDAHLDVRSTDRGLSSGTPFFRMLEQYPDVDFAEIGIQSQCNSQTHLQWVKSRGARVLTQEETLVSSLVSGESFATAVLNLLGDWLLKPRPAFISVDIDGFSSAFAPGCSQSWSTGFLPHEFFALLSALLPRLDVRVLGVYEVSPPLDNDDRTSKLAAQIIHRIISQ